MKMWMAGIILVGAVPGGWGEMKNLTAKAGDKVTLPTGLTGLDGEYILWYFGSNKTRLIHCDEGNMSKENESLDLVLDKATGSLTIFSIKYSGVYTAEIFDRNNMKHIFTFNVTVLEVSPNNTTAHQRNHWAVLPPPVLLAAVLIGLLTVANCGKSRGNSSNHPADSVV